MHGLRVAIVGAGIGGLTTALCLERFGHHPIVVEQTRALRSVGAGISLWPNGIKVLNLLGLGPDVAAIAGTMDRMAYTDRGGRSLLDFSLLDLYERVGERARPVSRAELQDFLLPRVIDQLGPDAVRLGVRAGGFTETDAAVTLKTEGGADIEADLVVAAGGTHSLLRDYVVGRHIERRYVGYVNWNGLVAASPDIAPTGTCLTWVGRGHRVSVMPVGGGRLYFFFDAPMTLDAVNALIGDHAGPAPGGAVDPQRHRAVLAERFAGWADPVSRLIERLDPAGVAGIPIHDVDPLPTWTRGRVALLGDAAHTMSPDLGQGGCQAMEDAWVLTHYLTSTSHSLANALARYQSERMPHTTDIVRRARKRSDLTHGLDPAATEDWYRSLEHDGYAGIVDGLAQSVETGPCRWSGTVLRRRGPSPRGGDVPSFRTRPRARQ